MNVRMQLQIACLYVVRGYSLPVEQGTHPRLVRSIDSTSEDSDEYERGTADDSVSGALETDVFKHGSPRSGIHEEKYRWLDGIVYYAIDRHMPEEFQAVIHQAMDEIEERTCIRFKNYKAPNGQILSPDYLVIYNEESGCSSSVGRRGGPQALNLTSQSFKDGTRAAVHELIHAIGFDHEMVRWDRDRYVTLHQENINDGEESNFKIQPTYKTYYIPYDYLSIMHSTKNAFSKDPNLNTITVVQNCPPPNDDEYDCKDWSTLREYYQENMGHALHMSKSDGLKINRMYAKQCIDT